MAEPISIISSAITIAATAAHISLALFEIAQKFKNAPEDIPEIAEEISSLSNNMNVLADVLRTYQTLCTPVLFQEIHCIL